MKIKIASLQSVIFVFQVAGFPAIAAISALTATSSTIPSIGARSAIVFISLIALSMQSHATTFDWGKKTILIAAIFWALYILRLTDQTLINQEALSRPSLDYWIWAIGGSLIPFLAIATSSTASTQIDPKRLCIILAAFVTFVVMLKGTTIVGGLTHQAYDSGRLQLSALNPISAGHIGVTLSILAAWSIFENNPRKNGKSLIFMASLFVLGIALLVLSASRGPILSLFAAGAFYFTGRVSQKTTMRMIGGVIAAMLLVSGLIAFNIIQTEQISKRITSMVYGEDLATNERLTSYAGAIDVIRESPITGSSIEEPNTGNYPHNIFLEAAMSTGAIGVGLLAWLIARLLRAARGLIKANSPLSWASLLFVQYLVAALFSGAIYSITTFWAVSGFIISAHMLHRKPMP